MEPRYPAVLLGTALLLTTPVHADDGEWKHELAPYVWATGMNGTVGVGSVSGEVDMSFGDILDELEMGFMGLYRGSRDKLSITVDTLYMGLGTTGRGPGGRVKADVDMDQFGAEVDVGYEVRERLTVFCGLRYNDLSVDVETTGPLGTRSAGTGERWVDPVIGAHYTIPFADVWSLTLRGDIGGFGVGSDFAWQGAATLRWQVSERFGVLAAYRYLDMDYEDGKDGNYFKYDMAISGPALGGVFTF